MTSLFAAHSGQHRRRLPHLPRLRLRAYHALHAAVVGGQEEKPVAVAPCPAPCPCHPAKVQQRYAHPYEYARSAA